MSDTTTGLTNRALAERVGWRVRPWEGDSGDWVGFGLVPDHLKDRNYIYAAICDTADQAWAHAPDYLGSVDAALTLPLDAGYRFLLFGVGIEWKCYIENEVGAVDERAAGRGASAALAICAAWWAWQEAKGDV